MKGQFMIISAVIISLILMTTVSTISETSSQRFHPDTESYYIKMIDREAEKVDSSSPEDRESFRSMLKSFEGYRAELDYWSSQNCFNVTLNNPSTHLELVVPSSRC